MNQQNWYSDQPPAPYRANDNIDNKSKRSVSLTTLIAGMLITALLGGAMGGLIAHGGQTRIQLGNTAPALNEPPVLPSAIEEHAPSAPVISIVENTTPPTAGGNTYTKVQIVEMTAPSIVGIDVGVETQAYRNRYGQGDAFTEVQTGSGSGIIISADGYIVTNNHVISGADTITVYLYDDTEYRATLIATDEQTDIAIIKIEATGLHAAVMGDSDILQVGEDVVAIGNPLGELRGTATSGMVSALSRTILVEDRQMTLLQTDAAVNPGNSGGGLFNSKGELIGVINAKVSSDATEGLGFAIPVNNVKKVVADLMDLGYVSGRAYLGVYVQTIYADTGDNTNTPNAPGYGGRNDFFNFFNNYGGSYAAETQVQVMNVVLGSAAERAGILSGDLILQVGDTEISSQTELSNAIGEYNAGDTAILIIQRESDEFSLSVTFGESTPETQS